MRDLVDRHAHDLWIAYRDGVPFVGVHPSHGMIFSRTGVDDLEADMNNLRPSVARQITTTCAVLFVDREGKA